MKIEDKIYQEVNNLIKNLYNPNGTVNTKKLKELQLYGSPVNWGDLSCCYVERAYVVYVSEAAPDAYALQRYIEEEMRKKGYKVKVITEW